MGKLRFLSLVAPARKAEKEDNAKYKMRCMFIQSVTIPRQLCTTSESQLCGCGETSICHLTETFRCQVLVVKVERKGLSESFRRSSKTNTNTDLKEIGYEDLQWIQLAQDRTSAGPL